MVLRRFLLAFFAFAIFSTSAVAQKMDAAFVVGGSFVSDSTQTFGPVACPIIACPTFPATPFSLQTGHGIFLEGAVAIRLLDAKLASLHVELPVAGIRPQELTFSSQTPVSLPNQVIGHISTLFVTPGFKLKVAPGAPISPWASIGGGWARYSVESGPTTNKGALQYGGGADFKTGLPALGLRAEVRDFVSGDPNFGLGSLSIAFHSNSGGLHHHNILVGGGVVLRF